MNKSPLMRIVPKTFRIRNPLESPLDVWIEPWADRHELECGESLDVSFVGPECGVPVFLPAERSLAIYAWEKCDFVVFRDGRVAGCQPTVREIVEQELEIAKDTIRLVDTPIQWKDLEEIQQALDSYPNVNADAQEEACRFAGILILDLATYLAESTAATAVLWNIASRVIRTKGLVLTELDSEMASAFWSTLPSGNRILARAISTLPDGPNSSGVDVPRHSARRQDEPQPDPSRP